MVSMYRVLLVGIPSVPYGLPSWQEAGSSLGFLHFPDELRGSVRERVCSADGAVCHHRISECMYFNMQPSLVIMCKSDVIL
jgi:hypothetical protein